jgi:7,8-dihydropterin-6-yl-methyl-4-(beta-D-ribofuranosyl)aminobenzene 5'-phosphate synthase
MGASMDMDGAKIPAEQTLRITTLVDNQSVRPELATEHGLAFWIEWRDRRLLFDTGQGKTLLTNAKILGVPLAAVDAVVLSHGHWDHTGGLLGLLSAGARPAIFLHPDALRQRYSKWHKPPDEPIGLPSGLAEALHFHCRQAVWTGARTPIADGAWVTGCIPRRTSFEDVGGPFYLDRAFTRPDPIADDQAMWFETPKGTVVLLGCAHAGVVNTLDYVSELTGKTAIHAVLGGMHLLRAKAPRLEATLEAFRRHEVRLVAPAHCTGKRAAAFLAQRLPGCFAPCAAGSQFAF